MASQVRDPLSLRYHGKGIITEACERLGPIIDRTEHYAGLRHRRRPRKTGRKRKADGSWGRVITFRKAKEP